MNSRADDELLEKRRKSLDEDNSILENLIYRLIDRIEEVKKEGDVGLQELEQKLYKFMSELETQKQQKAVKDAEKRGKQKVCAAIAAACFSVLGLAIPTLIKYYGGS